MNRLWISVALFAVAGFLAPQVAAQPTVYTSPDVPSDPDGSTLLPWEIVEHVSGAAAPYSPVLALLDDPAINAVHKMDRPDNWLMSIETPGELAGLIVPAAEPSDVLRSDAGLVSKFFCGSLLPAASAVPTGSDIDAIYLEGDDGGPLVVSFDVPTTIGSVTFQPSQLVRYRRTGVGCTGWTLDISIFDPATAGTTYFPSSANVIGADETSFGWIFVLDVPTDLAPSAGPATYLPGQVVSFDSAIGVFDLFDDLQVSGAPVWPISSLLDALSCQANPGRVNVPAGDQITLGKAVAPDITVFWPASCASGAEDYGVYQGSIAAVDAGVYDHVLFSCTDTAPLLEETLTPAGSSSYYLLVPHNSKDEGAYGLDRDYTRVPLQIERPQAALPLSRCAVSQILAGCP